ncbi:hypothetical protein HDU98_007432 [Podochytrium sp. JEL0797]|nr:hypothetical protein HDU98_007432 [Podochytrium sp. JEL0797]
MAKKYKNATPARKPITYNDNQVPSKESNEIQNEALPKAFKLMLAKSARIEKKKLDKKPRVIPEDRIKPGESVRAFTRRIETDMRIKVNAAAKAETKTAQKRKLRLKERKQKREHKGSFTKQVDSEDEREFPKKEVIPFGAQAMEPPKLSVVPKKIGGGAGAIRAMQAAMEAKEKKEKDEERRKKMEEKEKERDSGLPSVGRKIKLKDLPLVKQKNLMEERQRVIDQYRLAKAASRAEK